MVSLILTLLFTVIVAISALVGFVRGLNKSVIRIMTLVLAIVLTFALAGPITNLIADLEIIGGKTIGAFILEKLNSSEMVANILEAAPLMQEAILVAPAFLIAIVIFPVAFLLFSFVSWIVFLCIQKPLREHMFKESVPSKKAKNESKTAQPDKKPSLGVRVGKKFAGLGIGVVTGALIFGMIMAPIFGLISVLPEQSAVDEIVDALVEQGTISESVANLIKSEYTVRDGALLKFYATIGATPAGKAYLSSVSAIEADGHQTSVIAEFDSILAIVETAVVEGEVLKLLKDSGDIKSIIKVFENKEFVDALMQDMFDSKLLRSAIPEIMAITMEAMATTMNVPANKEVVYDNMMGDIATAVKDADVDYDFIQYYEENYPAMQNVSYIDTMDGANYRDGSMTPEQMREKYDAEIVKRDALEVKISSILSKTVAGGTEEIVKSIAVNIVVNVQKQVAAGSIEVVQNFTAEAVKETISSISSSDVETGAGAGEATAAEFLGKLADSKAFETKVATVETIKESVRSTVTGAVKDDSKSKETASTFASVISNFAGAVSSAIDDSGKMDATKLDFNKVADAVVELQDSTISGLGSSVLDVVISGDLGKNEMLSGALEAVKEGYESGNKEIGGTISSAGAVLGLVGAMGNNGNGDNSEVAVNSITDLISNLNDLTITLIDKILTDEMIASFGVPAQYAKPSRQVFTKLLNELLAVKKSGSTNYDKEVDAILSIYNFATKGVDELKNITEEDVRPLIDKAAQSTAIYNTITSITDSNPFGIEIKNESDRKAIADKLVEFYNNSETKTPELRNLYEAVARMIGVDEFVKLG